MGAARPPATENPHTDCNHRLQTVGTNPQLVNRSGVGGDVAVSILPSEESKRESLHTRIIF